MTQLLGQSVPTDPSTMLPVGGVPGTPDQALQQQKMEQVAQQLAQQAPPPAKGSLTQLMNDPMVRTLMLGAVQGTSEDMEKAKLSAARPYVPTLNTSLGSGQQYTPTIGSLYEQAGKTRGAAPLGSLLLGR